jgi:hypothetical protein
MLNFTNLNYNQICKTLEEFNVYRNINVGEISDPGRG